MIKETMRNSFYQLLVVYTILIALVALGIFQKYSLQFHIFAIVLALIGISILPIEISEKEVNKKIHYLILGAALLIVIVFRVIPYVGNSIPLGYDAGLYKYGIEHGLEKRDLWILEGGMEPGFLYLMEFFKLFLSTQSILTWLLIAFCAFLGLAIYFFTKEFAGVEAALFSTAIYAFSAVQLKVFELMYYKNIIGLGMMLFAIYFLRRYEKEKDSSLLVWFVTLGGILLAIHRPTFYIFGLTYLAHVFIGPKMEQYDLDRFKANVISGILILIIGVAFYLGDFLPALTKILPFVAEGFVSPGEAPGTFISFFTYQFSTLFYLPMALLGLLYYAKKKEFNFVVIWAAVNLTIVYFQFFFFNRFIIHLDIALIILAGVGFVILKQEKKYAVILIAVLLISGGIISYNEAQDARPLISSQSLELIKKIPALTDKNVSVMSISSEYSPWVKGYSERTTIAPGLFDENEWNETQWDIFWNTNSTEETKKLMADYDGKIYLFAGTKSFNNPCFSVFLENEGGKIYEYGC